jgi:hypothetical protein
LLVTKNDNTVVEIALTWLILTGSEFSLTSKCAQKTAPFLIVNKLLTNLAFCWLCLCCEYNSHNIKQRRQTFNDKMVNQVCWNSCNLR